MAPSKSIAMFFFAAFVAAAALRPLEARVHGLKHQDDGGIPGISSRCLNLVKELLTCSDYYASPVITIPPESCCVGYQALANDPFCFCESMSSNYSGGFPINMRNVLLLPTLCGITPPAKQIVCPDSPVMPPAISPAPHMAPPAGAPAPSMPQAPATSGFFSQVAAIFRRIFT